MCIRDSAKVTVPEQIVGKPVTEIGEYAFAFNTKLKILNLPDSVKRVKEHAFFGCTTMHTLNINLDNLELVEKSTVNRCYKLDKEFKDRDVYKRQPKSSFENCSSMRAYSMWFSSSFWPP